MKALVSTWRKVREVTLDLQPKGSGFAPQLLTGRKAFLNELVFNAWRKIREMTCSYSAVTGTRRRELNDLVHFLPCAFAVFSSDL